MRKLEQAEFKKLVDMITEAQNDNARPNNFIVFTEDHKVYDVLESGDFVLDTVPTDQMPGLSDCPIEIAKWVENTTGTTMKVIF